MNGTDLARLLRSTREAARMTQPHLAAAADVSVRTVMRAEKTGLVSDESLRSICSVLGLDSAAMASATPSEPSDDAFPFRSPYHAERAALRLDAVLLRQGHGRGYDETRAALATMAGYTSWESLVATATREARPVFDEALPVDELTRRLTDQARALSHGLRIDMGNACLAVAEARVTAHPHGPHFLPGPSSSCQFGETCPDLVLEYRGLHPELGPLAYRKGELGPVSCPEQRAGYAWGRDQVARANSRGIGTMVPNVGTMLFHRPDEDDEEREHAIGLYTRLMGFAYAAVLASAEAVGYGDFAEFAGPTYGAVPVDREDDIRPGETGPDNRVTGPFILQAASQASRHRKLPDVLRMIPLNP